MGRLTRKASWANRLLQMRHRHAVALVVGVSTSVSLLLTGAIELAMQRSLGPALMYLGVALVVPIVVATPIAGFVLGLMHDLNAARHQADLLGSTDMLTGMCNRRRFVELAERELARAGHGGQACSVLLLDADDFKRINDLHGHQAGDAVLCMLAQHACQALQPGDPFARWGGEEFAALLPGADSRVALSVAQRVRSAVASGGVDCQGLRLKVTVSLGVATRMAVGEGLDSLLRRADMAMYQAKTSGKNTVVLADADLSPAAG